MLSETQQLVLFIIGVLGAKFYVYALYAKTLNQWFAKQHNPYLVSATRVGLSLAFTALNQFIFRLTAKNESLDIGSFGLQGVFLTLLFSLLAWYILLYFFYNTTVSKIKALLIGVLISVALAVVTTFVGLIIALSSVNFC